jgi:integrase
MSLKKLGPAKWQVRACVRDKHKGYPVSKQIVVTGSKAEAVMAEAKLLAKLRASSLKQIHVSTFGEAVDIYLDRLRAMGKGSAGYFRAFAHIKNELGHISLDEMPDRLTAYLKAMRNGVTQYGRPPGPAYTNQLVTLVRAVFNVLLDLEIIDRNPITKARFPKAKTKPRTRQLTAEERLRLFNAIQGHRPELLPLVMFMITIPCRVSELTSARKEQYSPINNTVYIPDSKADVPIYKPVPPWMVDYFRSIPDSCPWLFYWTDKDGKYHPWGNFRKTWYSVLRKAGLSDLHIHDLRHVSVTDLIKAGNTKQSVMLYAGWKTDMLHIYYNEEGIQAAQDIRYGAGSLQNDYKACNSM